MTRRAATTAVFGISTVQPPGAPQRGYSALPWRFSRHGQQKGTRTQLFFLYLEKQCWRRTDKYKLKQGRLDELGTISRACTGPNLTRPKQSKPKTWRLLDMEIPVRNIIISTCKLEAAASAAAVGKVFCILVSILRCPYSVSLP